MWTASSKHHQTRDTADQLMAFSFTTTPFLRASIKEGRAAWLAMMQSRGSDIKEIKEERHLPIRVRALAEDLRLAQDPDLAFFHGAKESLTTGLPIGFDHPLSMCPKRYEEKVKYRVYSEDERTQLLRMRALTL